MSKKFTMLLASLFLVMGTAKAELVDDGVYAIVNKANSTAIAENNSTHKLFSATRDADNYRQLWLLETGSDGKYTLRNAVSGRYVKVINGIYNIWETANESMELYVRVQTAATGEAPDYYYITSQESPATTDYAPCAHSSNGNIVGWTHTADASQWNFVSQSEIAITTLVENVKQDLSSDITLAESLLENTVLQGNTELHNSLSTASSTVKALGNDDLSAALDAAVALRTAIASAETFINTIAETSQLANNEYYKLYGNRGFIYAADGTIKGTNEFGATYDANNKNHHFAIIKKDDKYYLYNVGAQMFVAKEGNDVSLTLLPEHAITLDKECDQGTDYDWNIWLNGKKMNLSNSGAYGVYTNYDTEDDGNRWAIYRVGTFDNSEALAAFNKVYVTVNYVLGSKKTVTQKNAMARGETFSFSNPYVYTSVTSCTKGDETLTANNGTYSFEVTEATTVTVNLEEHLPFTLSENYENAVWYRLKIRPDAVKWVVREDEKPYDNVTTRPADDNGLWAFVGNAIDGVQVLNKEAGAEQTLSLDNTNNQTPVYMKSGTASWTLGKCVKNGHEGFLLRYGTTGNKYVHDFGGQLKLWDSSSAPTDLGSAFIAEAPLSITYLYKGEELTDYKVDTYVNYGTVHTITNPFANKYVKVGCTANGKLIEPVEGQWTVNVTEPTSVIVTITEDLPFKISKDFATANWQYLQIHSGAWEYVRNDGEKPYSNTTNANELDNGALWAFVGDALNGFKILNQKAGEGYTLNYDGTIVNGSVAYMKQEEKTWTIEKGNGGFVIRQGSNECLNDFNNELKVWKADASPNNDGSAFRTISGGVTDLADLCFPGIFTLQAERSPLLYDTNAETPTKLSSGMASGIAANGNDANQQFLISESETDGLYYLYSVGAAKFVDAELNFTDYPQPVLSFESNAGNPVFPWFVKIGGKYVVPSNTGTAGNKLYHQNENIANDDGKRYRIEKVGEDMSLTQSVALTIQYADGLLKDASQLENGKVYAVYTYDRGAWYHNGDDALWSTGKTAKPGDAAENADHFAFLTVNGKIYLYSVGAGKFIVKSEVQHNGKYYAAYSDTPAQTVELLAATNGAWFPVVVKLNAPSAPSQLAISNTYAYPVIMHDDLSDTGNQVRIEEVGTLDLSAVVAQIEAYQINTEARGGLEALITEANTFLTTLPEGLPEKQALSNAKDEAQAVLDQSEPAATYELMMEKKEALATALAAVQEYPFINGMLKELTAGSYLIYYMDGETKHYLKTSAANSVITVADDPEQYPMPYEVTVASVRGKYSKAYVLKMNNLYISNTSKNASNIETKTDERDWSTQAIFEKDGKCAIRLTNAIDDAQGWHGHWFLGKGDTEGTTIAKDPEVATLEDLFIWTIEPYTKSDAQIAADELKAYLDQLPANRNIAPGVNNYSQPAEDKNFNEAKAEVLAFYNAITRATSVAEINEKKAYLEDLESRITINMPENGKFYRVRCTGSGMKYLQSTLDETNKSDIRLKVLSGATGVDATFCYVDGALLSYTTGLYINAYRFNEVGVKSNVVFTGASNGKYGRYNIKVGDRWIYGAHTEEGKVNKIDSGTGEQAGSGDGYTWWLEEVTSLPVTVTTAGWATLYAPVALTIPNGVEAVYTGTVVDNYLDLTAIEGGNVIPANTGVIIKAEQGTYNFTVADDVPALDENKNHLTGKYPKSAKNASKKVYTLQNGDNGVGFYLFNGTDGTNTTYINGFRAWVELDEASAPANALRIRFAGTTGIENSEIDAQGAQIIFDLTGRRVLNPTKGMYIVNGKKVIVK